MLLLGGKSEVVARVVDGADQSIKEVQVSATEKNRFAMLGGRKIETIIPSRDGMLQVLPDPENGEAYVWFRPDAINTGTVTVFVKDSFSVVYKLLLVPSAIAAEEILITPSKTVNSVTRVDEAQRRASSWQRDIKDLIFQMATAEGDPSHIDAGVAMNQELSLWDEARLLYVRQYPTGGLVGEHYILSNVSKSDLLVAEQEFSRRGVVAVAIENQTLPPGGGTNVYIVRERTENE